MIIERTGYTLYIRELDGKGREAERNAVKAIVNDVFGSRSLGHTCDGAPYIDGDSRHISVSHGAGVAVVAISDNAIGVDVEAPRSQLERIKDKFMNAHEHAKSLLHAWTAKEATFKAASTAGLTVSQIFVDGKVARVPDGRNFTIDYIPLGSSLIAVARQCMEN